MKRRSQLKQRYHRLGRDIMTGGWFLKLRRLRVPNLRHQWLLSPANRHSISSEGIATLTALISYDRPIEPCSYRIGRIDYRWTLKFFCLCTGLPSPKFTGSGTGGSCMKVKWQQNPTLLLIKVGAICCFDLNTTSYFDFFLVMKLPDELVLDFEPFFVLTFQRIRILLLG